MMSLRLMTQSLGLIRERKNFFPDDPYDEIGNDEDHAYHEREDEIVVS